MTNYALRDREFSKFDVTTNAVKSIDYNHSEVHSGEHFFYEGWTNVAVSGGSVCFLLRTPNTSKFTHLLFSANADNLVEFEAFENATYTGGGVVLPFNNNRNSSNVYTGSIISGTFAITSSGNIFASGFFGQTGANPVQKGITGEGGRESELVLKSGTTYLWCFKVGGNNTKFGWDANMYEHTNYE